MKTIWITGFGAVGPGGLSEEGLKSVPLYGTYRKVPADLPLKEGFPPAAMRWLDMSSLYFLNAARQALGAASVADRERMAVVAGLGWGSNPPVHGLIGSLHSGGFSSMNPGLFPYSVGNAPAAQVGLNLGLKGASLTLNPKEASGAGAIVEACRLLRSGHAAACLCGAVDHIFPFLENILLAFGAPGHPPYGEGAYALVLESRAEQPETALASVAAWATATDPCPPHRFAPASESLESLADALLDRLVWDPASVDWVALPYDTPALAAASENLRKKRFYDARSDPFQWELGLCGASWAAAAVRAALALRAGGASRALLLALSTGGGRYGLALEKA